MKILLIGDLHYGEKSNSDKFNQRVTEFIKWACDLSEHHEIDYVVQAGDWFHSRHKIDVSTLNHGIEGAKILGEHYGKDNTKCIAGNHDLYHLNRLDVNSISNTIGNFITVVDSIEPLGNVLLCPWITDETQWNELVKASKPFDYLIAHLELNGFYVTDNYKMEHGYSHKELKSFDHIFSGHYHSPQRKDNVSYIGTPYPITMSEANEAHGVWILDTNTGDLGFIEYEGVRVVSIPYTEIDKIEEYDPERTSIRIEFPDDLEDETLIEEYQEALHDLNFEEVKIKYRPKKVQELIDSDEEIEQVENIDKAVVDFLDSSSTIEGIDKEILKKYYNKATQHYD